MSSVRIRPGTVDGRVRAPPSKSYTHRALVIGHLAHRRFEVRNPLDADDTRATAEALQRLGTAVARGIGVWTVEAGSRPSRRAPIRISCRESGTTLRFACALAALDGRRVVLSGSERLSERPIEELLEGLRSLGARCDHVGRAGLPVEVRGPLHGGRLSLDASRSSQFASALLLALPVLKEDSCLELTGRLVSQPYLDATLAMLEHHGIRVHRDRRRFLIPGRQRPRGSGFDVPGDASSAAYLWAAAAVSDGTIVVEGIPKEWPQADLAVLDLLRKAGSRVSLRPSGARVSGRVTTPFEADLTDAPDVYPLAGVLAAVIPGVSRITGAKHLLLKESNRRAATAYLARRLGARVEVLPEELRIRGTAQPRPLHLPHLTDHRVVMSAAVGALAGNRESVVGEREAVRKSFPGFWNTLSELRSEGGGP